MKIIIINGSQKSGESTTPPREDGACCSRKAFDSGSIPKSPLARESLGAEPRAWTLHNESNTGIILNRLNFHIKKEHEVINYVLGSKQFSPGIYKEIIAGNIVVLAFPLYIDSIPSNVLKMLIALEDCIKKEKNSMDERCSAAGLIAGQVYAIINNGFYEGSQTHIAFEMIQNWCERTGLKFGGGIGQGAGEMLGATKNTPMDKGPFNNLERELKLLAEKIESTTPQTDGVCCSHRVFGIKYLSPYFPRFLWRFIAKHIFWRQLAYKNKLKKKDITERITRTTEPSLFNS
jgi:multimeric flavodoxin WrbA